MINDRNKEVLNAVVQSYILNLEPVGSRFVTRKYAFNLSPATIRNIMSDLEDMGFLSQPHPSAGRVPTDKGYRFYVDTLRFEDCSLDIEEMYILKSRFESIWYDVNRLLEEAAKAVSELTQNLVFAVPIRPEGTTLNRIQLYRYRNSQIVAVILSDEGLITNKILNIDLGLSQKELNDISDYLNSEFSGCTINQMRLTLLNQVSEEKQKCDMLVSKAAEICGKALAFSEDDLIVAGITDLLGLSEFSEDLNEIVTAIRNKNWIIKLLEKISEEEGVRVLIGSENPDKNMRNLSIVTARYMQEGKPLGSVGMIGPTHMDYSRAIPMVDLMARFISATISMH
jgi:heat-inducible transcriptional repressor